nr:hypothetical protein [Rubripirellula sp.]
MIAYPRPLQDPKDGKQTQKTHRSKHSTKNTTCKTEVIPNQLFRRIVPGEAYLKTLKIGPARKSLISFFLDQTLGSITSNRTDQKTMPILGKFSCVHPPIARPRESQLFAPLSYTFHGFLTGLSKTPQSRFPDRLQPKLLRKN